MAMVLTPGMDAAGYAAARAVAAGAVRALDCPADAALLRLAPVADAPGPEDFARRAGLKMQRHGMLAGLASWTISRR